MHNPDLIDVVLTFDDLSELNKNVPCLDMSLVGSYNYEEMEMEVFKLTNIEREKHGIHPLAYSEVLSQSALLHNLDMAEKHFISHTGSDGSTLKQRVLRLGNHNWILLGENLAMGQQLPAQVVSAWMRSSGHRENLLNQCFLEIGVAYIEGDVKSSDGSYWRAGYWVQHFGARNSFIHVVKDWFYRSKNQINQSEFDIKVTIEE